MVAFNDDETLQILHIVKETRVAAPLDITFEALIAEMTDENQIPGGEPMPMKLEQWPGGRWYRDLGNNTGHFWGHVQVIKPPTLIEICGPMFMSYAAASHLQYRLTAEGDETLIKLIHRAFGTIPQSHREGVNEGWQYKLNRAKEIAESKR
jgi:uncharacterized protein YndB with AHSA1/START domain